MESAKAMKRFVECPLWPRCAYRIVCFERKREKGEALLRDAAAYCRTHGIQAETEVVAADPREELLAYAERWPADVIVMGSSSRLRVVQHVLGDVVLTAIRHSKVPLYLTA
jgi:nucleotide-binding universal stress UspA family protein